jgi:hypothetical protein
MEEPTDVATVEKVKPYPFCISKFINKFSDILKDDFQVILPPNKDVDYNIEMHVTFTSPIKTPYRLNQKKL